MLEIRKVIHNEFNLQSRFIGYPATSINRGNRIVNACDVKAIFREVYAVACRAAAKIYCPARLQPSTCYQAYQLFPWTDVPWRAEVFVENLVERLHQAHCSVQYVGYMKLSFADIFRPNGCDLSGGRVLLSSTAAESRRDSAKLSGGAG
jgi:hypothetical protein